MVGFLGTNIKHFRKQNSWSLAQLGEMIGVGKSTVSGYENGKVLPPIDKLLMLSELFGQNIDDLVNVDLTDSKVESESLKKVVDRLGKRLEIVEQQLQSETDPEKQKALLRRLIKEFPEEARELGIGDG